LIVPGVKNLLAITKGEVCVTIFEKVFTKPKTYSL
jgi:hypothetical protein